MLREAAGDEQHDKLTLIKLPQDSRQELHYASVFKTKCRSLFGSVFKLLLSKYAEITNFLIDRIIGLSCCFVVFLLYLVDFYICVCYNL